MIKHRDFVNAPIWPEPQAVFVDVVEVIERGLFKGLLIGAIISAVAICFASRKFKG